MRHTTFAVLLAAGGMTAFVPGEIQAQMATGTSPGILPYTDAKRVANGQQIYDANCAACHGADLQGQPDWRVADQDGFLPAPPHDETGHTWHHDDILLFRIVALGTEAVVGGSYKSNMMGFQEILTEDQVLDVLAYIKSTWPEDVIEVHNEINARAQIFGQ